MMVLPLRAQEPVYWDVVQQIREEAFTHSQVMETASWLCDVFGPRNAKSPSYIAAAKWAESELNEYGLSNVHLEPYEFGTGYVNEYVSVHLMKPRYMPIIAYPVTWSSGTNGKIQGPVVYINFEDIAAKADLDTYRGKLKNAIVFTKPKQEISPHFEGLIESYSDAELDERAKIRIGQKEERQRRRRTHPEDELTRQQIIDILFEEGAAVMAGPDGRNDFGNIAVENSRYTMEKAPWEEGAITPPPEKTA